jgi:predicted dienelactone hydrolase
VRGLLCNTLQAALAVWLATLACHAQSAQRPEPATALHKVGLAQRSVAVEQPYDWRDTHSHALSATIWYPATATAAEEPQWIGPPDKPLFAAGRAAPNAALIATPLRLPLILLSHGTGGAALQMGWLGTVLAAHGYIAVAVNHPGNNAVEGYTARGFATWWERARDLSAIADAMLKDPTFRGRIDARRIGAAGFSLGGYTMIAIAGGITDPSAFFAFCKSAAADDICKSPQEFPTLNEDFERLSNTADFQMALRRAGDSYRDPRVHAVFAMAPALGPAFPASGLARISIPVEIVAGTADANVPIASSAVYLATHIPNAKLQTFPGVGHYAFLDTCTDRGRGLLPLLCNDELGVNREAIHAETAALAVDFFRHKLQQRRVAGLHDRSQ